MSTGNPKNLSSCIVECFSTSSNVSAMMQLHLTLNKVDIRNFVCNYMILYYILYFKLQRRLI